MSALLSVTERHQRVIYPYPRISKLIYPTVTYLPALTWEDGIGMVTDRYALDIPRFMPIAQQG